MKLLLIAAACFALLFLSCHKSEVIPTTASNKVLVSPPSAYLPVSSPGDPSSIVSNLWYDPYYGYYVEFGTTGRMTEYSFSTSPCSYFVYDTDSIHMTSSDTIKYFSSPGSSSYSTYLISISNDTMYWNYTYSTSSPYRYFVRTAYSTIQQKATACGSSGSGDSYEPDNSIGAARSITLGTTSQSHTIYPAGDYDYYSINITSTGTRTITTGGSLDMYLTLYGTNGTTILDTDDDSGVDLNPLIQYTFTATGTYYFAAKALSSSTTGSYTISYTSY